MVDLSVFTVDERGGSMDGQLLEKIYQQYEPLIYNYFYRSTLQHHLSEELTQETFLKAFKSIKRFKMESSLKTWLFVIARNTYLDSIRKKQSKEEIIDPTEISLPDHSDAYSSLDEKLMIRKVLLMLSEKARTYIILRDYYSFDEELKERLKKQKFIRNMKIISILVVAIIVSYFLFFRFSFLIESTNVKTPSFEQDFEKIQEKLTISDEAGITNLSLRFNSTGQMEDFRTRVVDFSEESLDIYDITFSPRIEGFHMYRVKHDRVDDPTFISSSDAQLPAKKAFTALDRIDYDSLLTDDAGNRYLLSTDARMKDVQVIQDVHPEIFFP